MYNWTISVLSNDAKWMRKSFEELFVPQLGMTLVGYTGKIPVKISSAAWDRRKKVFFITVAWMVLDGDILDAEALKKLGWENYNWEDADA